MRRTHAILSGLAAAVSVLATAAGPSHAAPRVTVIGDSVQETLDFSPAARAALAEGLDLRIEAAACRKLASPGCIGGAPESALALARRLGPALGRVVVVNVGYNDHPGAYAIPDVLSALRAAGVRRIVWVTLRERQGTYRDINAAIRRAAARSPRIRVADWSAAGSGRPWFGRDGVHLTPAGATALAGFLRGHVVAALAGVGISVRGEAPPVITRTVRPPFAVSGIAGDRRTLWAHGPRALAALDGRTGRPVRPSVPVDGADALRPDRSGGGLWLQAGGDGSLSRAVPAYRGLRGPELGRFAPGATAVRAGSTTWVAGRALGARPAGGWPLLAGPLLADARGAAAPRQPARVPTDLAASRGVLWVLVPDGAGGRLERRAAAGGRLVAATEAPPSAALVATRHAAWLLAPSGLLRRVGVRGDVRIARTGIRAVASDGARRLWALRSDGRTVLRLEPATGRVLALGRTARPASQLALTRGGVWATGGPTLERVREGAGGG